MKSLFQLLVVVGLVAILSACGKDAAPTTASVAELCTLESNTLVEVEGKFALPTFLSCQDSLCRVNFADGESGVMVELIARAKPTSNMLRLPPREFTYDDLSVVLDDGATVADRSTEVSLVGMVRRPSVEVCYLDACTLQLAEQ